MADLTRPAHPRALPLTAVADLLGAAGPAAAGVLLTGLAMSSQRVRPGDLYAAVPGSRAHGASYAADAVSRGAVAVVTDADGAAMLAGVGVPVLVAERLRERLGALASATYGDPAAKLTLMGITGTQGKTTSTRLLEAGLDRAGVPAAVIGTVGTRVRGHDIETALTTPEAPDLHGLFARMVEDGVRAVAMEVSSHALVMGRVDGVVFDVACFTNLGRDHLDFHPTVEDYFAAKAQLFTRARSRRGLVNADDEFGRRLLSEAEVPLTTFSAAGGDAAWRAVDVVARPEGSRFTVVTPAGDRVAAGVALAGDFNVANALAAIAVGGEAGFEVAPLAAAIASGPGVPGRLERIDAGQEFLAIVDYAHKPDAVSAALTALRPLTAGRLILVIGAGGDRDRGKRPQMGEIGARLADVLIVTDDNPRTEPPETIRSAVLAGAGEVPTEQRAEVHEIGDRHEAIRRAIGLATAGDTVVVAGKGHETGQEIDGELHPFDDRDEVRAALGELDGRVDG